MLSIISGPSGIGKSTLAEKLLANNPSSIICSADHYFINENGEYNFSLDNLNKAHHQCWLKTVEAVKSGKDVILDNTNVSHKDVYPYLILANKIKIKVLFHIFIVNKSMIDILFNRNVHGVHKYTIERQIDRLNYMIKVLPSFLKENFPNLKYEVIKYD